MADRKYLKRTTANGKTYLFFRFKGKLTPLPPDEDSAAFRREYDALLRAVRQHQPLPVRTPAVAAADTVSAAIDVYMDSAAYAKLAASTKEKYQYTLNTLRARLGAGRFADVDCDAVDIYTDQLAKEYGTSVGDRHKSMISKIWQVCRKFPQFGLKGQHNPTRDTEKHYTVQRAHRPWPPAVQDAFMAGAAPHMQLAKLLLHFSAQRGCDCVKMLWTDYDGRGITVRQQKTHGDVTALADYYICPKPLRDALDAAPRAAATILVNGNGGAWASANVLSQAITRELIRLGLVEQGARTFTMHGLRKTAAADVGSLGVGAAGVKSVGGWKSDSEANYYAQHADRRRINELVVEQWDAALDAQERAADVATRRAQIKQVS